MVGWADVLLIAVEDDGVRILHVAFSHTSSETPGSQRTPLHGLAAVAGEVKRLDVQLQQLEEKQSKKQGQVRVSSIGSPSWAVTDIEWQP